MKHASAEDVDATARAAGRVLAVIHAYRLAAPGFLRDDLSVGDFESFSGDWSDMLRGWLLSGRSGARLGPDLTERLLRFIADHAHRLEALRGQASLLHADYKPWNLLIRDHHGRNVVDAVERGTHLARHHDFRFAPLVLRHAFADAQPGAHDRSDQPVLLPRASRGRSSRTARCAPTNRDDLARVCPIVVGRGGGHRGRARVLDRAEHGRGYRARALSATARGLR
ncbi:MAG: hypothetical protein E6I75_24095 [Chloroflexi bacterium]|nr:MAG: hypothetical protein E6I75_24095 [Chloroflexota bacterium]